MKTTFKTVRGIPIEKAKLLNGGINVINDVEKYKKKNRRIGALSGIAKKVKPVKVIERVFVLEDGHEVLNTNEINKAYENGREVRWNR